MFINRLFFQAFSEQREVKAGGVYPVLKELEEKGYIKGRWKAKGERRKKIYEITDEGKRILEIALHKQQQMAETIGGLFRQFAHEVLGTYSSSVPRDRSDK